MLWEHNVSKIVIPPMQTIPMQGGQNIGVRYRVMLVLKFQHQYQTLLHFSIATDFEIACCKLRTLINCTHNLMIINVLV